MNCWNQFFSGSTFAILQPCFFSPRIYITHAVLEVYNELVHAAMTEADIFEVLAKSAEFENVQVNKREEKHRLPVFLCPSNLDNR